MKLTLLFVFFPLLLAQTSVVKDFRSGIYSSIIIIGKAKAQISLLTATFDDLTAGLMNLYNYPVQESDLYSSANDIRYLAQQAYQAQNQPFDATKVDVWPTLNTLSSLRRLIPSDPAKFQASVAANGGISGLVARSIPLTYQLITNAFQG